ncbi:hypothetical protein [Ruminococcus sp.]|uniref:hypothetical protein n=1 Tax=Ruminococcus sp. TaxID=41978 RepID=UPI00388ED516
MKKLILISGLILAVYLILMTVIAPQADAPSAVAVKAGEGAVHSGYTVGVSEGRIAVFRDGELYLRTETTVSSLPRADQLKLEEGIRVDSLKELKKLMQDYCS